MNVQGIRSDYNTGFCANPVRGNLLKQSIAQGKVSPGIQRGIEQYEQGVRELPETGNIVLDLTYTLKKGMLDTYHFVVKPFENTCDHCKSVFGGLYGKNQELQNAFPIEALTKNAEELASELKSIHEMKASYLITE